MNPDQVVLVLDMDNNTGVTYFELKDMRAQVVEEPDRKHIPALLKVYAMRRLLICAGNCAKD